MKKILARQGFSYFLYLSSYKTGDDTMGVTCNRPSASERVLAVELTNPSGLDILTTLASVAQSVEQLIRNEQVVGSNPTRSSKRNTGAATVLVFCTFLRTS